MCWRRSILVWSTASEAALMVEAIEFGACMLCILSSSAPGMFRKYERTRRVGSLACVASCASLGQCRYVLATRVVCAWAMHPLYVGLSRNSVMCSMPICVALTFIGA